jgi:hypothetical protein
VKALLLGLLLVVMPAAAQEPDVVPVPTGKAACDKDGPNCIVSRATLITSNMALEMAGQRIQALEEALKAKTEEANDWREEAELKRPRCAQVQNIPVPGTRS